jgi:hypothetical protein
MTAAETLVAARRVLEGLRIKRASKENILVQLEAITDELQQPMPDRNRVQHALEVIRNIAAPVAAALPIKFQSCFISYSTKDEEFAAKLSSDLEMRGVRTWFAPHDIKGGKKLHEQIKNAIEFHDRVLLILSEHSTRSEWVKTEIANARKREIVEKRQILFPIRIAGFEAIRKWECFDADIGKDSAREIREYFIPDFSNWKDEKRYEEELEHLLRNLDQDDSY